MRSKLYFRQNQRGAVTLIITLLVMIAITIGSFSLVQTGAMEQRMTANEQRSREAFHAAQAGIDFILAHLSAEVPDVEALCNNEIWELHNFVLNFEGPRSDGRLNFTPAVQTVFCESVPFGLLRKTNVWSRGMSRDGESNRMIVSTMDLNSQWRWGYKPTTPQGAGAGKGAIIAKGGVHIQGNADTGVCDVALGQCQALAQPGAGNREGNVAYEDENSQPYTMVRSGGITTTGGSADRLASNMVTDPSLTNIDQDTLFREYVAADQEDPSILPRWNSVSDFSSDDDVVSYSASGTPRDQAQALSSLTSGEPPTNLLYVDGDLTLRNGTIGDPSLPLIIVVNGDLNLAGNMIIWGTVFVTGEADFSRGTNKILGSLVTMGNVDMRGNPAAYYNAAGAAGAIADLGPELLADPAERTVTLRVGSWREVVN